jgi:hypothetical protein
MARLERELTVAQSRLKSTADTYGIDNLHLTVAKSSWHNWSTIQLCRAGSRRIVRSI